MLAALVGPGQYSLVQLQNVAGRVHVAVDTLRATARAIPGANVQQYLLGDMATVKIYYAVERIAQLEKQNADLQ